MQYFIPIIALLATASTTLAAPQPQYTGLSCFPGHYTCLQNNIYVCNAASTHQLSAQCGNLRCTSSGGTAYCV
ncbi:hypothetical protein GQ43DRAFT_441346 [Delitschia confertaspora ATCC 74209]|uniref:Uncharacterized protein n=1 Tax=Delitschia confertaspora ATCC 74209 TaxID=1513339 RepID=A0A9P4MPH4_9PLEO|nr:hypothetical protein GQ43DRAFT_441346 [Delitschia confertaspora ATCC 74209]